MGLVSNQHHASSKMTRQIFVGDLGGLQVLVSERTSLLPLPVGFIDGERVGVRGALVELRLRIRRHLRADPLQRVTRENHCIAA